LNSPKDVGLTGEGIFTVDRMQKSFVGALSWLNNWKEDTYQSWTDVLFRLDPNLLGIRLQVAHPLSHLAKMSSSIELINPKAESVRRAAALQVIVD
jgi:hypothetical protein